MLLPQSTNLPEGVIEIIWCCYRNQHVCQRGCRIFSIPYQDKLMLLPPINIFAREGASAGFLFLAQISKMSHVGRGSRLRRIIRKQKSSQTLGLEDFLLLPEKVWVHVQLLSLCTHIKHHHISIHGRFRPETTNKQVHQVEIHERAMPVQYTPWHSSSLQICGSWSVAKHMERT